SLVPVDLTRKYGPPSGRPVFGARLVRRRNAAITRRRPDLVETQRVLRTGAGRKRARQRDWTKCIRLQMQRTIGRDEVVGLRRPAARNRANVVDEFFGDAPPLTVHRVGVQVPAMNLTFIAQRQPPAAVVVL